MYFILYLIVLALETTTDTLPSVTLLQSGFSKSLTMVSKISEEDLYFTCMHDMSMYVFQ